MPPGSVRLSSQQINPPADSDKSQSTSLGQDRVEAHAVTHEVTTPHLAPVAALKPYGVNLSIQQVNDKVQQITDAHQQKFGVPPSPGLVFDLLKADPIIQQSGHSYSDLLGGLPTSQREAQVQSVAAQAQPVVGPMNQEYMHERADGLIVHPTPPGLPRSDTLHALHKEFPTVQMGMIPASWGSDFMNALNTLANIPDNLKVTSMGMDVGQYEDIAKLANQNLQTGQSDMSSFLTGKYAQFAVKTVSQGQVALNRMMGTNLPITGYINQDWEKAIADWMKTRSYFQRTAQYQANQAGFKNYGDYLKAFQTKTNLVHKHGFFAYFLNALPVNVYAHGSNPLDILISADTLPFANPSISASYPLHVITRAGGEALDILGGATLQTKADLAAGNEFVRSILPKSTNLALQADGLTGKGQTIEQAKQNVKKVLNENPSWMRVFLPDAPTGKDEPGWMKAVDKITNFTGDLILLRKPALTGEVVEAGSVARAARSDYVNAASKYAYAHLQEGKIGRASALLEGGQGSERLSAAVAQSVKRGWMTYQQFRDHLAELYATGRTVVRVQRPEPDTVVNVYHGTDVTTPLSEAATQSGEFGHAVYVSPDARTASEYANVRAIQHATGPNVLRDTEQLGAGSSPNVRLLKIDTAKLFPYKSAAQVDMPALIKKVLSKLTPEERKASEEGLVNQGSAVSLDHITNPQFLYEYLTLLGQKLKGVEQTTRTHLDAIGHEGPDFANEVLQRAGFSGVENGKEIAVFNAAKTLRPAFEKPVEIPVQGPTLDSLRSRNLITSKTGLHTKEAVRNAIDNFSAGAQAGGRLGNLADDFAQWLRSEFSHAAPRGYRAAYDPRLPERLHDFVLRHFQDPELANKFESQLVRARATGNTPKIDKLMQQVHRMYYAKYPVGPGSLIEDDPFLPFLESEAGSRVFFPSGNVQNASGFDNLVVATKRTNKFLNSVGQKLRRILIISPSLFWKHAVGDTVRRFLGGDNIIQTPGIRGALNDIKLLTNENPELARRWGTFLDRVTNGEAYYMAAPDERTVTFDTKKFFGQKPYMNAAGRFLRTMLDDKAFAAYKASTPEDLSPLMNLIENNRVYRRLWSARQKIKATEKFGKQAMDQKVRIISAEKGILETRKEMMATAFTSHDYAAEIFNRYKNIEEAAQAQGTSLYDALDVLRGARGPHADEALGKWITDNGVDFHVEKGLVSGAFSFDTATSKIVQKIMYFNKANRNGMARNIAALQFKSLMENGWDREDALHVAMSVAEKQTVYHMLDFANMLQVEQDLRWLSYFATKHRLYWKWVFSTVTRHPGTAASLMDIKQHLDRGGNFDFHLNGWHLQIPAARLLWVTKEYPEESPLAGAINNSIKNGFSVQAFANGLVGSLGSGFQRNAVPALLLVRAAAMDAGWMPATYTAATKDLDATNIKYLNREVNHFQMDYFADHGHYATQAEAIKHALYSLAAQNAWRSNLPLPVIRTHPNETQALLDQFMKIDDPRKRSRFLDQHPALQAQFGVSSNPNDFIHYQRYWSQYTQALDQYHAAREQIYQAALTQGMTAKLDQERQQVSMHFQKIFDRLKAEDLAQTPVERRKEINGEVLGLWGQQISADPLVNPYNTLHTLLPGIPKDKLLAGLPSQQIKDAKMELALLNDPKYVAKTFPDAVTEDGTVDSVAARERRSQLLTFIQEFQPFSHDNLGAVEQAYQEKYVNPYWQKVDQMNAAIKNMPRGQKGVAYANLRDWKDLNDQPVKVNGVEFPPPIVSAWENLPPDLKQQRLAALATGSWSNLADYEKKLLGFKPAQFVSHGWAALAEIRKEQSDKGHTLAANQIQSIVAQIDKQIPGFKADWNLAQQPRVALFEKSTLYKNMPNHVREFWDNVISPNAHAFAQAINDPNRSSADKKAAKLAWEKAVNMTPTKDMPVGQVGQAILNDPIMEKWLKPYLTANPDFLNTIINKSYSNNG